MQENRRVTFPPIPTLQLSQRLRLIAETLLMTTLLHALAALVLGNFRFASFFERAHSDFSDSRARIQPSNPPRCNSVLCCVPEHSRVAVSWIGSLEINGDLKTKTKHSNVVPVFTRAMNSRIVLMFTAATQKSLRKLATFHPCPVRRASTADGNTSSIRRSGRM